MSCSVAPGAHMISSDLLDGRRSPVRWHTVFARFVGVACVVAASACEQPFTCTIGDEEKTFATCAEARQEYATCGGASPEADDLERCILEHCGSLE
jgi:hypothetical protein